MISLHTAMELYDCSADNSCDLYWNFFLTDTAQMVMIKVVVTERSNNSTPHMVAAIPVDSESFVS